MKRHVNAIAGRLSLRPPQRRSLAILERVTEIHRLEPKRESELRDSGVLAKRDAAVQWCKRASQQVVSCGGKRWTDALIPHDAIAENMTLRELAIRFDGTPA
jgi:type III restriction enzyme